MTAAERALAVGIDKLSDSFATNGTFTVDGNSTVFRGVISQERYEVEAMSGGLGVDYALTIVAARPQFEAAGVEPSPGQSIKYQGRRWIIDRMPYRDDDPVSYHIEASAPQGKR